MIWSSEVQSGASLVRTGAPSLAGCMYRAGRPAMLAVVATTVPDGSTICAHAPGSPPGAAGNVRGGGAPPGGRAVAELRRPAAGVGRGGPAGGTPGAGVEMG